MRQIKAGKRRTKRPAKQLLFLLIDDFLRKSRQYDTALDLACGAMYFADVLPARKYIGVDLDLERLKAGKAQHPHADTVHSKIEDLPSEISGDVVVCLQCVGVNKHFDNRQALAVVDRILAATRPGGDLILNVGPLASACFSEIDNRVRDSFTEFHRHDYGRFGWKFLKSRKALSISMLLAHLMRAFPSLAYSPRWRLYLCRGKQAPAATTERALQA